MKGRPKTTRVSVQVVRDFSVCWFHIIYSDEYNIWGVTLSYIHTGQTSKYACTGKTDEIYLLKRKPIKLLNLAKSLV